MEKRNKTLMPRKDIPRKRVGRLADSRPRESLLQARRKLRLKGKRKDRLLRSVESGTWGGVVLPSQRRNLSVLPMLNHDSFSDETEGEGKGKGEENYAGLSSASFKHRIDSRPSFSIPGE